MKKSIWLIIFLSFFLAFNSALAGERLDEMVEAIEAAVEDPEEQEEFIEAVEDYIQFRDATLLALSSIIGSASESTMQSEWQSTVDDLKDLSYLYEAEGSLSSEAAIDLYDQFISEEQTWVSALSAMKTAYYRDEIIALRVRLFSMTQLLETKWQGYLNDDNQLDEKELRVFGDVSGIYSAYINDSNSKRETIRAAGQFIAEAATKADKIIPSDGIKLLGQVSKEGIGFLLKAESSITSSMSTLEQYMNDEMKVLVLFKGTRADTELFIKENNFDVMQGLYGLAEDDLETFAYTGTSSQQDDTEVFMNSTKGLLSKHVSDGKKIFDDFVVKHQFKFFGPLSPEIKLALLEESVWLSKDGEIKKLDLERFLRTWRDDIKKVIEVDLALEGISDDDRKNLEAELLPVLDEIKSKYNDDKIANVSNFFVAGLKAQRDKLLSFLLQ